MLLPCVAGAFLMHLHIAAVASRLLPCWFGLQQLQKLTCCSMLTKFAGMSLVKGEQHNMNMMLEARVAVYRDQRADQSSSKVAQAAFQWVSCSCSFRGASVRALQSGASLQLWCKVGRHSATRSYESSSSRRSVAGCNPVMSAVHMVQKSACARRVAPSNGTSDDPCSCTPCSCT